MNRAVVQHDTGSFPELGHEFADNERFKGDGIEGAENGHLRDHGLESNRTDNRNVLAPLVRALASRPLSFGGTGEQSSQG